MTTIFKIAAKKEKKGTSKSLEERRARQKRVRRRMKRGRTVEDGEELRAVLGGEGRAFDCVDNKWKGASRWLTTWRGNQR